MIWSGQFDNFAEVTNSNAGYLHERWIERSVERLRSVNEDQGASYHFATSNLAALEIAVGAALQHLEQITVLDVGGNLGQVAVAISKRFEQYLTRFVVVERRDFLEACASKVKLPPEVDFRFELSKELMREVKPNVVYFGSSIQYFEDWRLALEVVSQGYPAWVVLADVPCSHEVTSFISSQQYYEEVVPCWFFRCEELITCMKSLDFSLFHWSESYRERENPYFPEPALPAHMRISNALDFVFSAKRNASHETKR